MPECHAQKLLPTTKVFSPVIAIVLIDTTDKLIVVNKRHELRENIFALIHFDKLMVKIHKLTQNQFKSFELKKAF